MVTDHHHLNPPYAYFKPFKDLSKEILRVVKKFDLWYSVLDCFLGRVHRKMPHKKIPSEDKHKVRNDLIKGLSQVSQIGIGIFACVAIGVVLGWFLDSFFGTSPWLLLLFSFFGAGAAFKYLYDLMKKM